MFLPDVNVWLALSFPSHFHHKAARAWFMDSPKERTCLFCRITQAAFLRLANNPRAFPDAAVTQDQAWQLYDLILIHERVGFAAEPPALETTWRQFTQFSRHAPHAWTDAYLAAFAHAADFELVTFDRGFTEIKEIRCTVLS